MYHTHYTPSVLICVIIKQTTKNANIPHDTRHSNVMPPPCNLKKNTNTDVLYIIQRSIAVESQYIYM